MTELLIRLDQAQVKLRDQTIIHDVSFSLSRGDIVTVIGPNGAGKTTLVRAILGLQKLSDGTITRKPGLKIGYMPQKLHIDNTLPLTVERFLLLTGANRAQLTDALSQSGIVSLRNAQMQSISGGELQRVLLARAVLRRPDILILDEPAQGVDLTGQTELYRRIRDLRDELGCAVLMVSHDLHLVMASTDRVICLNQHICCSGLPEQVSNDPAYLALFGQAAQQLAVYHHHHNHAHNMHGDIVAPVPHMTPAHHVHHAGCQHGEPHQSPEKNHA
ncbi:MAG: zinc ABC transporter ATP-binding protein ZnuC [Hahellaceae bacterium]|nr:zinc ABC transporter ATP-binding protein ZnuC [Hahellaceae bacterium]MCP5169331.1 zinc ABC transporter ATP-binding protein ZnuC [Hahellaceae bacterium]